MHAQRTNSLFDIGEHESSDLNPHYWVDEANQIANNFVYKDIDENVPLSEEYIKKGREIANR